MSDQPREPGLPPLEGYPEEDSKAPSSPRRAASAEFAVRSEVGSQAMLREAMDPANQSLREALRLSFRVLQAVILVLVILFVFSGFKSVSTTQSGVLLQWGRIASSGDLEQALAPGLRFSRLPYPAGEFVVFEVRNRAADAGNDFWQAIPPNQTLQDAVERASVNDRLMPGRDGSLITKNGDIAHAKLGARFQIDNPVRFVHAVENESPEDQRLDADRLVSLALKRAAVHAVAQMSLTELLDVAEHDDTEFRRTTQDLLDQVDSGIEVVSVEMLEGPTAALAYRKRSSEFQAQREQIRQEINTARQDAKETLTSTAGEQYQNLLELIEQYEVALDLDQEAEGATLLGSINDVLESSSTAGEVSKIIGRARSYNATIDSTLGVDARRLKSLLPKYREQPQLIASRLWAEARSKVLAAEDIEVIAAPTEVGRILVSITGSQQAREIRRDQDLKRRERETYQEAGDMRNPYLMTLKNLERWRKGQAGRVLPTTPPASTRP